MALTEMKCKNAKTKGKPYKLSDANGLYLLIKPNSGKYWRYKYRVLGKEKTYAIGVYPEISLSEAREKHREMHKYVALGTDPNFLKQEIKLNKKIDSGNTFEVIAREWLENKDIEWSKGHRETVLSRLIRDVFPKIGNYPIRSITAPTLLSVLKEIESRGVYETTKRIRQYCGQVFRYAIATGRAERDPSQDIKGALKIGKVKHYKAIDLEELPKLFEKLDRNEGRLFPQTILALRLMVITFLRKKELTHGKWKEVNFQSKQWIVPAERMKMKKEHIVPLSKQATAILMELKKLNTKSEHIFPKLTSHLQPMHEDTILRALYRLGFKGEATIHGFRAFAMTHIKEKLGYRHEVPDRQLAHARRNSVDAAYDRAEFMKERTEMMQEWADYIDTLKLGRD